MEEDEIISDGVREAFHNNLGALFFGIEGSLSDLAILGAIGDVANTIVETVTGEVDEVITTATIHSHEFYLPVIDFLTIDGSDIEIFQIADGQMRDAFCAIAQSAINKLAEDFGITFEIPDSLANDPNLVGAISALAIAASLYGDLTVNNSLVQDALFGIDRNDGRTATGADAELSLHDLLSGSGAIYRIEVVNDPNSETSPELDWNHDVNSDADYVLSIPSWFWSDRPWLSNDLIFTTLIHELGHGMNFNGNTAPWDVLFINGDNEPGYHSPGTPGFHRDSEHDAHNEMTDALAQLIMSYAQNDNTDTILDGIDGSLYEHCELDFGG